MEWQRRYFMYGTVVITGAAVLVVEVAAVRLLSPYYGSSLYVFSSVLTVILAALSVGYYIGGKFSDRYPSHEILYNSIVMSGLLVLLTQFLAAEVLPKTASFFSLLSGGLIYSILFFFLPAFFLGLVSPYIVKLLSLAVPKEEMGGVVGATFFWGTFGSIAGSLLTGFVFIPHFGVQNTMIGTGITLVFLGLLGTTVLTAHAGEKSIPFFVVVRRKQKFILLTLLSAACLYALIETGSLYERDKNVIYESDGLYSHILVYEDTTREHTIRALKRDANNSSATFLESYDLVFGYTQFGELYTPRIDAERYLVIGGGAYSIPRTLVARDPDILVDVVEIEPVLFDLSKEYFDLSDTERIQNYVVDGRVFLDRSDTKYDVIFGDAFGTDMSIPQHLATKEFFEEVREDLTDDGLFILNHIGTLAGDAPPTLTGSLVATLGSVFPNIKMYVFNKRHPTSLQNIIFIASMSDEPIDFGTRTISSTGGEELSVEDMAWPLDRFDTKREMILTDDRAPVEYLAIKQF